MRPSLVDGVPRHRKLVNPSIGKFYGHVRLGDGHNVTIIAMNLPVHERLVVGVLGYGVAEFDGTPVCPDEIESVLRTDEAMKYNLADLINDQFGRVGRRFGSYPDLKGNDNGSEETEGSADED